MRLPRWITYRKDEEADAVPTEEEGQIARRQAERRLRETTEAWAQVHDVSAGLERARQAVGPDPFLEELAKAMRPRPHHHREA